MHQVSVWKSATSQALHLAQTLPWQWRTQVGDTTTAVYWAALKPTRASKEFPGQQPHLVLLEQLAGEKLFTWCSYVPQRLPERGMNTWNTKLSSRAYTNTLPPLPSLQTALTFLSQTLQLLEMCHFCQHTFFCHSTHEPLSYSLQQQQHRVSLIMHINKTRTFHSLGSEALWQTHSWNLKFKTERKVIKLENLSSLQHYTADNTS